MGRIANNDHGMTLVEILVVAGVMGIIGLASMTLFNSLFKGTTTMQTKTEVLDIANSIKSLLATQENCTASFGKNKVVAGSAVKFETDTFGLKEKNSFGLFSDRFKVKSTHGVSNSIQLLNFQLREEPSYSYADGHAILFINFKRSDSSYAENVSYKIPLWINTNLSVAQGGDGDPSTIDQCRSLLLDDQIWKKSATSPSNIYYDSVLANPNMGVVTIGTNTDFGFPANAKSAHISRDGIAVSKSGPVLPGYTNPNQWPQNGSEGSILSTDGLTVAQFSVANKAVTTLDLGGLSMADESYQSFDSAAGQVDTCAGGIGNSKNSCLKTVVSANGSYLNKSSFGIFSSSGSYITGSSSGFAAGSNSGMIRINPSGAYFSPAGGMGAIDKCLAPPPPGKAPDCAAARGAYYTTTGFGLGAGDGSGYLVGSPGQVLGYASDGGTFAVTPHTFFMLPDGNPKSGGFQVDKTRFYIGVPGASFHGSANAPGVPGSGGIWMEGDEGVIRFMTFDGIGGRMEGSKGLHLTAPEKVQIDSANSVRVTGKTVQLDSSGEIKAFTSGGINLDAKAGVTISSDASVLKNLDVKGDITANEITAKSDIRLKTDIRPISNALEKILELNGVSYYWKDKSKSEKRQLGLLAQEVEQQFPEAVRHNEDGFLSVNYMALVGVVVEAIKELFSHVKNIDSETVRLQREIENLKAQQTLLMQKLEAISLRDCSKETSN